MRRNNEDKPLRVEHKGKTYELPQTMTAREWLEITDKEGKELADLEVKKRNVSKAH